MSQWQWLIVGADAGHWVLVTTPHRKAVAGVCHGAVRKQVSKWAAFCAEMMVFYGILVG